jgi:hypothetical protein
MEGRERRGEIKEEKNGRQQGPDCGWEKATARAGHDDRVSRVADGPINLE